MKKLIFPSLLLIGINAFSQQVIPYVRFEKTEEMRGIKDTVHAYFTIADVRTNHVKGVKGYLVRFRVVEPIVAGNTVVDKITTISTLPLDYRRKPFPKTILVTFTKEYDQEPVIW